MIHELVMSEAFARSWQTTPLIQREAAADLGTCQDQISSARDQLVPAACYPILEQQKEDKHDSMYLLQDKSHAPNSAIFFSSLKPIANPAIVAVCVMMKIPQKHLLTRRPSQSVRAVG